MACIESEQFIKAEKRIKVHGQKERKNHMEKIETISTIIFDDVSGNVVFFY